MSRFLSALLILSVAGTAAASPAGEKAAPTESGLDLVFETSFGARYAKSFSGHPATFALSQTFGLGLAMRRNDGIILRAGGVVELNIGDLNQAFLGGLELGVDVPHGGGLVGARLAALTHSYSSYDNVQFERRYDGFLELGLRVRDGRAFASIDAFAGHGGHGTSGGVIVGGGFTGRPARIALGVEALLAAVLITVAFRAH